MVEQPDYEDSSDDSDDSIGSVQESVAEDMQKLEATFKGISKRFRLINRIGEGTRDPIWSGTFVAEKSLLTVNFWNQGPSLQCTKLKIYSTIIMKMIGTSMQKTNGSGRRHHSRRGGQTMSRRHQQVTARNVAGDEDLNTSPSRRYT